MHALVSSSPRNLSPVACPPPPPRCGCPPQIGGLYWMPPGWWAQPKPVGPQPTPPGAVPSFPPASPTSPSVPAGTPVAGGGADGWRAKVEAALANKTLSKKEAEAFLTAWRASSALSRETEELLSALRAGLQGVDTRGSSLANADWLVSKMLSEEEEVVRTTLSAMGLDPDRVAEDGFSSVALSLASVPLAPIGPSGPINVPQPAREGWLDKAIRWGTIAARIASALVQMFQAARTVWQSTRPQTSR